MPFTTIPGQGFITCPEGFSTECCEPPSLPCTLAPCGSLPSTLSVSNGLALNLQFGETITPICTSTCAGQPGGGILSPVPHVQFPLGSCIWRPAAKFCVNQSCAFVFMPQDGLTCVTATGLWRYFLFVQLAGGGVPAYQFSAQYIMPLPSLSPIGTYNYVPGSFASSGQNPVILVEAGNITVS